MSRSENLAVPPRLPTDTPNPINPVPSTSSTSLQSQVTQIVSQLLSREMPRIISAYLNPSAGMRQEVDQGIADDQRANISDMDKIPDVVRSLRDFSGQPGEYGSWKKSVDRILRLYEPLKGTPKYFGILNVVRNKIVGQADIALESYNTPLNWESITRCLSLHYADKRDLGTLEYQMTGLVQGNSTVQQFYHTVYAHLSLILNKISTMEMSTEAMHVLVSTYREKALDVFIRGLKGDLPRLLGMREPADLPQALHLCLKLENMNYRTLHVNHTAGHVRRVENNFPPRPPPRQPVSNQSPRFHPQQFHHELLHGPPRPPKPQYNNQNPWSYNQRQVIQQLPQANRNPNGNQQKPEPMETETIYSKQVNYQNRPQFKPNHPVQKRPAWSAHAPHPNKIQRNFHTTTEIPMVDDSQQADQTIIDYVDTYEQNGNNVPEYQEPDLTDESFCNEEEVPNDVHFLD